MATRTLLLGIAVLTAALSALPADAQTSRSGGSDRRAQSREAAPAKVFPDATREVEEGKVSRGLQRQLNDMIEALNDKDDPAKAREIAEAVLANERANAYEKSVAAQVAGNAANELDDLPASIAFAERALAENGLDNEAHYATMQNLAITYLSNEQPDKAIATLERLINETQTKNPDILFALAGAHYESEQYPQAIDALKRTLALAPTPKPEWIRLLASAYTESDQPAEAATTLEQLVALQPDDKRLILALASAYIDLEQSDKAIATIESARSRGLLTEARDYQNLYALYFNIDGKEREVIAVINEGLAKGVLTRDLQTLGALAQAAYFAEDMPLAIATYREAAALDPKGEAGLNYAKVLSAEARDAEARDAAKAALAKGVAKPGEAWMVIARSENELDNRPAVRAALLEAAKHAETREQANKMLSQLR
ncbi:MAG: tetratricopeptide repeat protein [Silanimonas sp.]